MALGDYLASLNLSPAATAKLTAQYGPPKDPPPADEFAPPTAADMQRYGVDPGTANRLAGANAAAAPGQSVSAPTLEPGWTPEVDTKRKAEGKQRAALEAATPQGAAGSDGFPTYKDLSGQQPGVGQGGGAVMPMRAIAAHWQPGTRSFSAQYGMDQAELEPGMTQRDAAAGHALMSADKKLDAAQQQAQADVAYAVAHKDAADQAAAQLERVQQDRAAYVAQEREKLEGLSQAATAKVDVDLAQGPVGAQVMSAIMVGLGQFGAALTGGPNTAYQIINDGINRRMRAQEVNIANAGKAYEARKGLYAQNLAEFGDKERATLATKVAYLDQAKALLDQQYAKAKGTANEGVYHDLAEKISNDRAQAADQFAIRTHTQKTEQGNEHYVPTQYVGGPGAGAGQKGKEGLYVPTLNGYARDPETAKKLNEQGAQRMQINEDLREMNSLLQESKGLSSVTDYGRMQEIKNRIGALKNGVLQRTTVLAGQGAMSNGDKDVAEIRSALSSVDPQFKTNGAIERMQKGITQVAVAHQRDHRIAGEAAGVQLGQEQYVAGPSGPTPVARLQGKNKTVTKETESFDDVVEKPKGVSAR